MVDRVIMHHRGPENWARVWNKVTVPNAHRVLWFTVVRNPWDRMVSVYHFLKKRGAVQQPFPDWARSIDLTDHFTRPQSVTFLRDGERLPVRVIPYETLDASWAVLAGALHLPPILPRLNTSTHEPYQTYYDDETRDLVGALYQHEIDALGYEF